MALATTIAAGSQSAFASGTAHSAFHSLAQIATPGCNSNFNLVPGGGGTVAAMAAASTNDIWAVGTSFPPTSKFGPPHAFVEHWDGTGWTNVSDPIIDRSYGLAGVATVAGTPATVWIVGGQQAAQWNGTAWNAFTLASSPASLTAVLAISSTNVWAVGSNGHTLIEHFDGTTWSVVASPNVSPTSSDSLLSVAATSASDIWAVGQSVGATSVKALIEHWDGSAWSIVANPTTGAGDYSLASIAAISPSMAWAVGYRTNADGFHEPLIEQWNVTTWVVVPSAAAGAGTSSLGGVAAVAANNVWAVGGVSNATLVEHWDGARWSLIPSANAPDPSNASGLNATVAVSPSNVWTGGWFQVPISGFTGLYSSRALFENLCVPPPTISSVAPLSGNPSGGTSVNITGTDLTYATSVSFGGTPATSFSVTSDSGVTAVAPPQPAGTVDVSVTTLAGMSAPCLCDVFTYVPPAVSWQQYQMSGSDGATWKPIDTAALSLALTPSVDSNAILTGNADLWTATVGVNQDLGIFVSGGTYGSGQLVGWKESGGYGGTFSPNAAFLQTVIPVKGGTAYAVTLKWKANHATRGTLFIAAGGSPPAYSPTRLTAELVAATDSSLQTAVGTGQYTLAGSDGSSWEDMDPSALVIPFTPTVSGSAVLSANADLWTQKAGVNQDLGISVSGGAFGTGQIVGWKESGGFAGTFSPNAAYAQTVVQLIAATPYVIKVKWKANLPTAGTIRAGAGLGPEFSPTRLLLRLYPGGTGLQDAASNQQYRKAGSTGSDWSALDSANLRLSIMPASNALYILTANVDLWTAMAAVNQDIGIVVSGGAFGSGILVAWKESGGYSGTFSPNAAFVQTVIPLAAATTYIVTLAWKANVATTRSIYAGAGIGPQFSPTRITAQLTS